MPSANPGAVLNGITGVVTYASGNYENTPVTGLTVATPSTLTTEVPRCVAPPND